MPSTIAEIDKLFAAGAKTVTLTRAEWEAIQEAPRTRGSPADVLKAAHEPRLTYYPVRQAVGSPKNDAPNLVEPIDA